VLDKAKVLGKDITSASATQQTSNVYWQTNLNFNSAGGAAFGTLTEQMNSKYASGGQPTSAAGLPGRGARRQRDLVPGHRPGRDHRRVRPDHRQLQPEPGHQPGQRA